jgi:putative ABC transport system permease protein
MPMILLRLISWPYARKHVLRTLLTAAGIVLGIAVFVGMNSANRSVLLAFSRTVDRIAGKTELQVTAGEVGFAEEVLDGVQSAQCVRVAVPVIEAVVDTTIRGEGSLLVLGVDLTGDRTLRDYDLESGDEAVIDDPLVFLAQPDSLMISKAFADKNGLGIGSQLALGTLEGARRFTVRGIMKAGGLASAFGGNIAVMDIYAAQKMFGRGRTFDRIDLALNPDCSLGEGTRELEGILGPGFQIEPPSGRGQHFEAMIASYSVMMGASSLFALLIGMFIIYNAFAIAVTERRPEIGVLRALGATRGQIRALFLGESAVIGIVGSLVGLGAGILIARGIAASVTTLVRGAFGVAGDTTEITVNPVVLGLAVAIGIATSLVAATIPAGAAARIEPVQALQTGKSQTLSAGENRWRVILAAVCAAGSAGCLIAGGARGIFYTSYLLTIAAVLLLAPLLSLALARVLRPGLKRLRPVEGALAADSLVQAPRRTSATVAALMLSVALVVTFAGMARSSYLEIIDWVHTALNPDLFLIPTHEIAIRSIRFPAAMAEDLQGIAGIRNVQGVREVRVLFRKTPVKLLALDLEHVEELTPVRIVSGNREMFRVASRGDGVLVSDNLAKLHGARLGETLELAAPAGVVRLPIVGIIVEYSDQQGSIVIDRSVYHRYWQDDSVNMYRVYLSADASFADVKRRILDRYAGVRRVFVLSNDELRDYILRITNQWFALTYIQVAIAVLVAVLGIVNTLTVSITDRRRELGVLRAVGGLKGQVRRTIRMEALSTAALGLVLGCAFGAVNLYYVLQIIRNDVVGMRLDYHFPAAIALLLTPVILSAAFIAAIWPSHAAVRGSLVEALEYE